MLTSCFVLADHAQVPDEGFGVVLDGVRHLLRFALDLLTVGRLDERVDSEYVQDFGWYHTLPGILAANEGGV